MKTMKKSQKNVMSILPSEIINLIRINQEESNNYCIRLFEVYEDSEFVHLILEYSHGGNLKHHLQEFIQDDDSFDELGV